MTDHGCSPNGSEQLLGRVLEAVRRGDLDSVAQSLEPDLAAWLADHTLQRSKPNWLPLAHLYGRALEWQARWHDAADVYHCLFAIHRRLLAGTDTLAVSVELHRRLAQLMLKLGQLEEARFHVRQAFDAQQPSLPATAGSLRLAMDCQHLAVIARLQGSTQGATFWNRRALAMLEAGGEALERQPTRVNGQPLALPRSLVTLDAPVTLAIRLDLAELAADEQAYAEAQDLYRYVLTHAARNPLTRSLAAEALAGLFAALVRCGRLTDAWNTRALGEQQGLRMPPKFRRSDDGI